MGPVSSTTTPVSIQDLLDLISRLELRGRRYLQQKKQSLLASVAMLEQYDSGIKAKALFIHEEAAWLQIKIAQNRATVLASIDNVRRAFLAMLSYLMLVEGYESGFSRFLKMVREHVDQATQGPHANLDSRRTERVVEEAVALVATLRKKMPPLIQEEVERCCEALPALRWEAPAAGANNTDKEKENNSPIRLAAVPRLLRQAFQTVQSAVSQSMKVHIEKASSSFFSSAKELPGLNHQTLLASLLVPFDDAFMQGFLGEIPKQLHTVWSPYFFSDAPAPASAMDHEIGMGYYGPVMLRKQRS